MDTGTINLLAVFVAAIVAFVVGWLWYSPWIFGDMWMRLQPRTAGTGGGMTGPLVVVFIAELITAWTIAYFAAATGWYGGSAIKLAFVASIGFTGMAIVIGAAFSDKSWKLYAIDFGHYVLTFLLMGAVIGYWR
jgi:hypothetical protein